MTGIFFVVGSGVALGFLVYSLVHRRQLGIGWGHPRILVEGGLFLVFLTIGVILLTGP